jgi:hypothetical protein
MQKIFLSFFFVLLIFSYGRAQEKNTQLGSPELGTATSRNAYYDYSDPTAVNIKISVWGAIRYPGKYLVPNYTSVLDLITYAGGPEGNSEMDDLKIYRIDKTGKEKLITFSYDDIVNGDKLEQKNRIVPKLEPGDFLIIPSSGGTSFREYLSIFTSIFSFIVSVFYIIVYSRTH